MDEDSLGTAHTVLELAKIIPLHSLSLWGNLLPLPFAPKIILHVVDGIPWCWVTIFVDCS